MVTTDSKGRQVRENQPVQTQMCFVDSNLALRWFTFDGDLSEFDGAIINGNSKGNALFDRYTEEGEHKKIPASSLIFCGEAL